MPEAQFCVNWLSYKKSITEGFSRFQQDGEFVDMTLAAEGHFVKVHKNVVAVASPYLKAMIQSAPCQHPVVFLNNMSHTVLGFILEYIYTGEVMIPTELIPGFIEACKALCINGLEDVTVPKKNAPEPLLDTATIERPTEPPNSNFAAHIKINSDNYDVEVIPIENKIPQQDTTLPTIIPLDNIELIDYHPQSSAAIIEHVQDKTLFDMETDYERPTYPVEGGEVNQSNILINIDHNAADPNPSKELLNLMNKTPTKPITDKKKAKTIPPCLGNKDKTQYYSTSSRGSLLLLLNHYIYYCHHQSCGGQKRRWRCTDYRKLRCPALIDTDNENIVNRSEVHVHANHDAKILKRYNPKLVFASLSEADQYINSIDKEKHKKPGKCKKLMFREKKFTV